MKLIQQYENEIEDLRQQTEEIDRILKEQKESIITVPTPGVPLDAEIITGYNILPIEGIRIERKIEDLKLELAKEKGEIDEATYQKQKSDYQIKRHNEDASIIKHGTNYDRKFYKLCEDGIHYEKDEEGNYVIAGSIIEEYPTFSTFVLGIDGIPQKDEEGKFIEAEEKDPLDIYKYKAFDRQNQELEENVKETLDVDIHIDNLDMSQKIAISEKVLQIKGIKQNLTDAQKHRAKTAVAAVAATCGTVALGLLSNMDTSQLVGQGTEMIQNLMNGYETGALQNLSKCLTAIPAQVYAGVAVVAGNLISTIKSSKLARKLRKKLNNETELNSEAVETIANFSEPITSKTR